MEAANPGEFKKKRKEMQKLYQKIIARQIRIKENNYRDGHTAKGKDFYDVMSSVLDAEMKKTVDRLGWFKSVSVNRRAEKLDKEEKELQEGNAAQEN